jgi:hypothetical protein
MLAFNIGYLTLFTLGMCGMSYAGGSVCLEARIGEQILIKFYNENADQNVTIAMEPSPPSATNSDISRQGFPCLSCKSKLHSCVNKSLPLDYILSQLTKVSFPLVYCFVSIRFIVMYKLLKCSCTN